MAKSKSDRFTGGKEVRPGVWIVRVSTGVPDAAGRYREVQRTVHGGIEAAKKRRRELLNEVDAGDHDPKDTTRPTTIAELMAAWEASRTADWTPATRRSNRSDVRLYVLPHLGRTKIDRLTVERVERWHRDLQRTPGQRTKTLSTTTIRKAHRHLQTALDDAMRWGIVNRNVAQIARKPKATKPQMATVSHAEIGKVFAKALETDIALATLIGVAAITGARRGSVASLRWGDINLDDATVEISAALTSDDGELVRKATKTGQSVTLGLDPVTVAALRRWRTKTIESFLLLGLPFNDDVYVWRQRGERNLRPIHPDTISHKWRELADGEGLANVRFHDIRSAVVDALMDAGRSPRRAADHVTHANPSMTLDVYTRRRASDVHHDDAELLGGLLHGN